MREREQTDVNGTFDASVPYGINFVDDHQNADNSQYLAPIPYNANNGNNVTMSLEDFYGNDDFDTSLSSDFAGADIRNSLTASAVQQLKFVVLQECSTYRLDHISKNISLSQFL